MVHLDQRNSMIPKIDSQEPRAVSHFKACYGIEGWENPLFYVNRFFDECIEKFEYEK